jgi:LTXXQ motif family protein
MHPAVIYWWKNSRREESCGIPLGCGPSGQSDFFEARHPSEGYAGAVSAFGVRRPLRFLAHKLQLRDDQIAQLAAILDALKIERAQAAVDDRRTVAALADAIEGGTFDEPKAREAGALRVKSAGALSEAVVKALGKIHGLLDAEQRARFAYLIRTGAVIL